MNYAEYRQIMNEQQLIESETVKLVIEHIKSVHSRCKHYSNFMASVMSGAVISNTDDVKQSIVYQIITHIESLEKEKNRLINIAIEIAEYEKLFGMTMINNQDDMITLLFNLEQDIANDNQLDYAMQHQLLNRINIVKQLIDLINKMRQLER